MFPSLKTTTLSFGKILSSISKTLNVANQLIPLYTKAKPLVQNSTKLLNGFSAVLNKSDNDNSTKLLEKKTESSSNNPVFFS